MAKELTKTGWIPGTPRKDSTNVLRYLIAMFVWGVCFTASSQLLKRELVSEGPVLWLVVIVPSIAAAFVLLTFFQFLRDTDELQRKVQLHALAIGFGGTFFAASAYRLLMRAGAPPVDLGDIVLVMAVLYSASVVVGWSRYR